MNHCEVAHDGNDCNLARAKYPPSDNDQRVFDRDHAIPSRLYSIVSHIGQVALIVTVPLFHLHVVGPAGTILSIVRLTQLGTKVTIS